MSDKNIKQNKLAKNYQKSAIIEILTEVRKKELELVGWRIFVDKKVTVRLTIEMIKTKHDTFECSVAKEDTEDFNRVLAGETTLNCYLPCKNMLFQAKINDWQQPLIRLRIPDMIAVQERRRHFRLQVQKSHGVKAMFSKQYSPNGFSMKEHHFNKSCADLGKGGCSFILTSNEARMFVIEEEITKVQITVNRRMFVVDMELVNLIKVEPDIKNKMMYAGMKACFKFTKISEQGAEFIDNFVIKNINYDKIA
jgi:hypothetical protein